MDFLKLPIKIGLTVDLYSYGVCPEERGEYVHWFAEDTEGFGPQALHVYTPDGHVHTEPKKFTAEDKHRLEDQVGTFARFLKEKAPQVEYVSWQFPYNQLPIELSFIRRLDNLYGGENLNSQWERLSYKVSDLEKAYEMLVAYAQVLSNTDFSSLQHDPVIVLHAGGIVPYNLFRDSKNPGSVKQGLALLREIFLEDQLEFHQKLLSDFKDFAVTLNWENIPPYDSIPNEEAEYQWLTEHCFEDFEARLLLGGSHTIDLAHIAMVAGIFRKLGQFLSLDIIKEEYGMIPPSARSVKDYIKVAHDFFSELDPPQEERKNPPPIVYHLNDCNGLSPENEGVPIGAEGSIIPWSEVIGAMSLFTQGAYAMLEIMGSHIKENYDQTIRRSLFNFVDLCVQ